MTKFDWYQGTIHGESVADITDHFMSHYCNADLSITRPKNGYTHGAKAVRGDTVLAEFWYGGNDGVHVKMTGSSSPKGVSLMRYFEHRVTRVDSCMDWIEAGLFDRLAKSLTGYAMRAGIKISQQGDWIRGEARTLYLGARSSTAQLVLYEKGYESEGDPNWVRLEARVYPKGQKGYRVASWSSAQVFGGSAWMTKAMAEIGYEDLQAQSVGTVWRPSDAERSRRAICRQYRNVLEQWATEVGGWHNLGGELKETIEQQQKEAVF